MDFLNIVEAPMTLGSILGEMTTMTETLPIWDLEKNHLDFTIAEGNIAKTKSKMMNMIQHDST